MKKIACIDIGTNSVRMIIITSDACIEAEKYMETTRIGHGVDETKMLSEAGIERTVEALETFYNIAKEQKADEIIAIATSAVRDAKIVMFF